MVKAAKASFSKGSPSTAPKTTSTMRSRSRGKLRRGPGSAADGAGRATRCPTRLRRETARAPAPEAARARRTCPPATDETRTGAQARADPLNSWPARGIVEARRQGPAPRAPPPSGSLPATALGTRLGAGASGTFKGDQQHKTTIRRRCRPRSRPELMTSQIKPTCETMFDHTSRSSCHLMSTTRGLSCCCCVRSRPKTVANTSDHLH